MNEKEQIEDIKEVEEKEDRSYFENCNIMGDRNLWLKFTQKVRLNKKTIWGELKPFIMEYLKR